MSDGARQFHKRIAALEAQVAELKRKVRRLFIVVERATDAEPFLQLMISQDATEAQESAVYDLMNEVDGQLSQERDAMGHEDFEARISEIFPEHRHKHFAESILIRLAREGGWERVYEHLRRSGMNLRDLPEERGY